MAHRRRAFTHERTKSPDQNLHVRFPSRVRQLDGIAESEIREIGWQVIGAAPWRPHQHRNDGNAASKRRRDFNSDEIVGVEAAVAAVTPCVSQPGPIMASRTPQVATLSSIALLKSWPTPMSQRP
jgi:hypothetical protein